MIVLLTDFGQSEYVGVMKAVIYSIDCHAKVVDLCHSVSAQNIIEGSWILRNNHKYFPKGSAFCCVIDPGVGTTRKALAVKTDSYYFVAPDNGLLWETLKEQQVLDVREIPFPPDASRTFHGRDVFAKAAAKIGLGQFDGFSRQIKNIKKLDLYQQGREGTVVRIDAFGNVVTNLSTLGKDTYTVEIEDRVDEMKFYPNYNQAEQNELFLIEGSNSTLEISLKNGNANEQLHLQAGTRLKIY